MRFSRLLVASLAAASCASPPAARPGAVPPLAPQPVPGAPPPAQAPPGGEAVRLGPSALRYVVHRRIHVEQQVQGRLVSLDRGVRAFISAIITGPADSAGYPLLLTIDSLIPDSGTFLPPSLNLAGVRALRYAGHVLPTGVLRNLVPSDSVQAWTAAQVFGSFQGFYPRLPALGLRLTADWTDTVTTTDRGGVEVTTTSINHSRAAAWEQRGGARCLRLEVTSTFTLAGSGQMSGQPREVSGSGTRFTLHYLAVDGRYLGGEVRDSMAIVTRFPVEGETVPGKQLSQVTVAVLP